MLILIEFCGRIASEKYGLNSPQKMYRQTGGCQHDRLFIRVTEATQYRKSLTASAVPPREILSRIARLKFHGQKIGLYQEPTGHHLFLHPKQLKWWETDSNPHHAS